MAKKRITSSLVTMRTPQRHQSHRVSRCSVLSAYPGPISVILCMAAVTLLSLLWCSKPFIIWCPLAWIKGKSQRHTHRVHDTINRFKSAH